MIRVLTFCLNNSKIYRYRAIPQCFCSNSNQGGNDAKNDKESKGLQKKEDKISGLNNLPEKDNDEKKLSDQNVESESALAKDSDDDLLEKILENYGYAIPTIKEDFNTRKTTMQKWIMGNPEFESDAKTLMEILKMESEKSDAEILKKSMKFEQTSDIDMLTNMFGKTKDEILEPKHKRKLKGTSDANRLTDILGSTKDKILESKQDWKLKVTSDADKLTDILGSTKDEILESKQDSDTKISKKSTKKLKGTSGANKLTDILGSTKDKIFLESKHDMKLKGTSDADKLTDILGSTKDEILESKHDSRPGKQSDIDILKEMWKGFEMNRESMSESTSKITGHKYIAPKLDKKDGDEFDEQLKNIFMEMPVSDRTGDFSRRTVEKIEYRFNKREHGRLMENQDFTWSQELNKESETTTTESFDAADLLKEIDFNLIGRSHYDIVEDFEPSFLHNSSNGLGIFNKEDFSDCSKELDETINIMDVVDSVEHKQLVMLSPDNQFNEWINLTKDKRLWEFPIDNEQDSEELKVGFHEHVFPQQYLSGTLPTTGITGQYMNLVTIGLSQSPYLTVAQKKAHIKWYEEYLSNKLGEINAAMEKTKEEQMFVESIRKGQNVK